MAKNTRLCHDILRSLEAQLWHALHACEQGDPASHPASKILASLESVRWLSRDVDPREHLTLPDEPAHDTLAERIAPLISDPDIAEAKRIGGDNDLRVAEELLRLRRERVEEIVRPIVVKVLAELSERDVLDASVGAAIAKATASALDALAADAGLSSRTAPASSENPPAPSSLPKGPRR